MTANRAAHCNSLGTTYGQFTSSISDFMSTLCIPELGWSFVAGSQFILEGWDCNSLPISETGGGQDHDNCAVAEQHLFMASAKVFF